MSEQNRVVILMTGSECEEYPGMSCVMDVLGPYTREEAYRVAAEQPPWTAPHIMTLHPLEGASVLRTSP